MKILSLSTVPLIPHLGAGNARIQWTKGLQNLGHFVDILQPSDFEIWPNLKRLKKFRHAFGVFFKVKKLLKTHSYDIIEFYGDEYWLLLLWLKRSKTIYPLLIAHADGIELYDMDKQQQFWKTRTGINKWLYYNTHYRFSKITFSIAEYFVGGCEDELSYVFKHKLFNSTEAVCIPPGINNPFHHISFRAVKENIIIFFGSWIERKGIKIIPKVISEVLNTNPEYSFQVFGAWAQENEILMTFDPNLHKRIKIFPKLNKEELVECIIKASIFFFPSYSEGFGATTVEAMSCSCAIVTTPTGIGSNLIHDKEAIICNYNDTTSMIKEINLLISQEDKRIKIAYNGFLKARDFMWDVQVKKLEKTYLSWLKTQELIHN